MGLLVGAADPTSPEVQALVAVHHRFATAHTPPEDVHAVGPDRLAAPDLSWFEARLGDDLVGIGALRHLDDLHGELKSIHTVEATRRRGIGRAVVAHLVAEAASRGYRRVSLETGTMEAFAPSRALYAAMGFVECPPFGEYRVHVGSTCMTLVLDA